MQCEICDKEYKDTILDHVEDLDVCGKCQRELGLWDSKPVSGFPVYKKRSTRNVHLNGSPACAPRPYGQLPGNGG